MIATIYSRTQIIGHADLKIGDEAMGHVYGTFAPNNVYRTIQKVVQKFNAAVKRDYSEWASLELSAQLSNGCFLAPLGGIEIDDLAELPHEPKHIDLPGLHSEVISDYFKNDPPKSFVLEPWTTLDIDRKKALEQELLTEISPAHVLADCDCVALCACLQCDDVLFSILSNGEVSACYALVHLTWSQKEQNPKFPRTTLFDSFEEFRQKRMFPDNIEFKS